jgi:hypothetical protein
MDLVSSKKFINNPVYKSIDNRKLDINGNPIVYFEPDEDFYNSITLDELLEGVLEDIHKFYASK